MNLKEPTIKIVKETEVKILEEILWRLGCNSLLLPFILIECICSLTYILNLYWAGIYAKVESRDRSHFV